MEQHHITPPEAVLITSESPLRVGRLIDMFLSRNDFDPALVIKEAALFYENLEKRTQQADTLRQEAERAREQAYRAVVRTNDIAKTLRRVRR